MKFSASTEYSWLRERDKKVEDDKYHKENDNNDVFYLLTSDLLYIKAALTSTIPTNTTETTRITENANLREMVDFTQTPDEIWS